MPKHSKKDFICLILHITSGRLFVQVLRLFCLHKNLPALTYARSTFSYQVVLGLVQPVLIFFPSPWDSHKKKIQIKSTTSDESKRNKTKNESAKQCKKVQKTRSENVQIIK